MSAFEYARRETGGEYVPPMRLYRVRLSRGMYGGMKPLRITETVHARGLRSAVRLAETLNPGYVATVVEA